MTKVLADDLQNNQFSSLVEFMRSASKGTLARHRKRIEITGLTNKNVKFLLHKFLHINHLSEYGILDTAGTFEIVHIRPNAKRTEDETRKTRMPFVPIHPPPTAVEPSLIIKWQGQPPTKKTRDRKK